MHGPWMPITACHPHCGCDVTEYKGCCLECPLVECYYVSGQLPKEPTPFQVKRRKRIKRVRELCSQGLLPRQVALVTGESKWTVYRLMCLSDD